MVYGEEMKKEKKNTQIINKKRSEMRVSTN